ncbi:MAG: helix-turn-helix domain-containing protein [Candidatus Baltobacteraceae bacterium]
MLASILDIAKVLHARRIATARSQAEVASQAGTPQSNLSAIENGKVDPRLSTLQDIGRALGLELVLVPTEALPAVRALVGQGPNPDERPLFAAQPD